MKKPVILLLALTIASFASAQKVYFAYFQSEDQSPFYIKLNNKVYSSASAGYLTISNLRDTAYQMMVGFSSNPAAEKKFVIKVNGSDLGISLKNLPDGPQLFDMQAAALIPSEAEQASAVAYETKSDRFSTLLSKAADDPTLLKKALPQEKPKVENKESAPVISTEKRTFEVADVPKDTTAATVVVQPETTEENNKALEEAKALLAKKTETPEQVSQNDKQVVAAGDSHTEPDLKDVEYYRSRIERYSETSTTEGFGLVFYDNLKSSTDTVRILIPNPKVTIVAQKEAKADEPFFLEEKKPVTETKKPGDEATNMTDEAKASSKKDRINNLITEAEKLIKKDASADNKNAAESTGVPNSSCTDVASEKDFFKLRRNMAGKLTDDAMIDEAKKFFKKQCFSVEHLRHLSSLFLTSAGKYHFFDAAFEFATDKSAFHALETEITDPYYLKRFKALVGE